MGEFHALYALSDLILNSHGHYTRTLEKTRRPLVGALHNSGSEERVWPGETTQPHVENALTSTPTHETVIELCSFLFSVPGHRMWALIN